MRAIGIIRKVDGLGRITLPSELRQVMNISEGEPLEIFTNNRKIILRVYETKCVICDSYEDLKKIHEKYVCKKCIGKISSEYRNGETV